MPEDRGTAQEVRGLSELVGRYDRIICDVWGVLHDGEAAFAPAVTALRAARAAGAAVIALSNSPKRAEQVREQLAAKGIGPDALEAVLTSGELSRRHLERHYAGRRLYHLGPERDRATAAGMPLEEVGEIERAAVILATGLVFETVAEHEPLLARGAAAGAVFVCANPDRVVRLGAAREPCAGALADRYEALGGEVVWMGKPAEPPYRACRRWFARRFGHHDDTAVLAIGDGLATDIAGAQAAGFATLLIEDGIHREELAALGRPAVFARYGAQPNYRMARLRW